MAVQSVFQKGGRTMLTREMQYARTLERVKVIHDMGLELI